MTTPAPDRAEMSVEVRNESGVQADEWALVQLSRHVLAELGVHPLVLLSLMMVDESEMARLNQQYAGEPDATDVLAFAQDEVVLGGQPGTADDEEEDGPPTLLGEVIVCPAVAERQARQAGHGLQDELGVLCVHGILHLVGYDHGEPAEEQEMFALQGSLLASWRERGATASALRR